MASGVKPEAEGGVLTPASRPSRASPPSSDSPQPNGLESNSDGEQPMKRSRSTSALEESKRRVISHTRYIRATSVEPPRVHGRSDGGAGGGSSGCSGEHQSGLLSFLCSVESHRRKSSSAGQPGVMSVGSSTESLNALSAVGADGSRPRRRRSGSQESNSSGRSLRSIGGRPVRTSSVISRRGADTRAPWSKSNAPTDKAPRVVSAPSLPPIGGGGGGVSRVSMIGSTRISTGYLSRAIPDIPHQLEQLERELGLHSSVSSVSTLDAESSDADVSKTALDLDYEDEDDDTVTPLCGSVENFLTDAELGHVSAITGDDDVAAVVGERLADLTEIDVRGAGRQTVVEALPRLTRAASRPQTSPELQTRTESESVLGQTSLRGGEDKQQEVKTREANDELDRIGTAQPRGEVGAVPVVCQALATPGATTNATDITATAATTTDLANTATTATSTATTTTAPIKATHKPLSSGQSAIEHPVIPGLLETEINGYQPSPISEPFIEAEAALSTQRSTLLEEGRLPFTSNRPLNPTQSEPGGLDSSYPLGESNFSAYEEFKVPLSATPIHMASQAGEVELAEGPTTRVEAAELESQVIAERDERETTPAFVEEEEEEEEEKTEMSEPSQLADATELRVSPSQVAPAEPSLSHAEDDGDTREGVLGSDELLDIRSKNIGETAVTAPGVDPSQEKGCVVDTSDTTNTRPAMASASSEGLGKATPVQNSTSSDTEQVVEREEKPKLRGILKRTDSEQSREIEIPVALEMDFTEHNERLYDTDDWCSLPPDKEAKSIQDHATKIPETDSTSPSTAALRALVPKDAPTEERQETPDTPSTGTPLKSDTPLRRKPFPTFSDVRALESLTISALDLRTRLTLLDVLLNFLLLTPLVVLHYHATCRLLEIIFLRYFPRIGVWCLLIVGMTVEFFCSFLQRSIAARAPRPFGGPRGENLPFLLAATGYNLVLCFGNVCHMLAANQLITLYVGVGCNVSLRAALTALVILWTIRSGRNVIAAPLFIGIDPDNHAVFTSTTLFQIEPDRSAESAADTLATVGVMLSFIHLHWAGVWNLMDAILFPNAFWVSMVTSLILGTVVCLAFLLLQQPAAELSRRLEKEQREIERLAFENLFIVAANVGVVLFWKGTWMVYDVAMDYFPIYCRSWDITPLAASVLSFVLLSLAHCSSSLLFKGCEIDGDLKDGEGIYFSTGYFTDILQGYIEEEENKILSSKQTTKPTRVKDPSKEGAKDMKDSKNRNGTAMKQKVA